MNLSVFEMIETNETFVDYTYEDENPMTNSYVKALFTIVYTAIFIIGLGGNVMICCSVFRQKSMSTVTNVFICNLAVANILLCSFQIPLLAVHIYVDSWPFGSVMCHLAPCIVTSSFHVSTLSLASIAVDRYLVIVHPQKERLNRKKLIAIIIVMWIVSIAVSLPYGVFQHLEVYGFKNNLFVTCSKRWPSSSSEGIYVIVTFLIQFFIPLIVIICYYVALSRNMKTGNTPKPECPNEIRHKQRTNRLLTAMAVTFCICWLPIQLNETINIYWIIHNWYHIQIAFYVIYVTALLPVCFNPLFYKWLNKITAKQFCQVGPCFRHQTWKSNENDDPVETMLPTNVYPMSDVTDDAINLR